ncbi:MAG: HAD family hydrolase [Candidatus Nanohalobium sp.]
MTAGKIPVFDIGDTLLPSHEKINKKVHEELEKEGVEDAPELPINEYNIYKPSEVEAWLDKHDLEADAEKLKQAYVEWEKDFLRENVIDELKKINRDFGPIGFISDNSIAAKKFYTRLFEEKGLQYKGFVVSEEVGVKKPDKEIFEAFVEERSEEAQKFVYFGNYVDRDEAAEKEGMYFVWDDRYHVFNSSFEGPTVHKLSYESVRKALNEVDSK